MFVYKYDPNIGYGLADYLFPLNYLFILFLFFWDEVLLFHPGWSTMAQSWLIAALISQAKVILPPQWEQVGQAAEATGVCHHTHLVF